MPNFHLVDPEVVDTRCILELRSLLSKSEALSTLKRVLSPNIAEHVECVQLFARPNPVDRLGAFVTFHSPGHAFHALQQLKKNVIHSHVLGAQLVGLTQQPGYYLPRDLTLPSRPFSNFRVIVQCNPQPNEELNSNGHDKTSGSYQPAPWLHGSSSFAVLNLHGIIDQGELEHILRLRITSHIPLVCVQIWRARSSQALHAYLTFLSRSDAQWAAIQLHGRKGTHSWAIRPMRSSELGICARPPTEEERVTARLGVDDLSAARPALNGSTTTRMVFSPTAAIIPFYAPLLPFVSKKPDDLPAPTSPEPEPESSQASKTRTFTQSLRHPYLRQSSDPAPRPMTHLNVVQPNISRAVSFGVSVVPPSERVQADDAPEALSTPRLYIAPATPPQASPTLLDFEPESVVRLTRNTPHSFILSRAQSQPTVPLHQDFQPTDSEIQRLPSRPKTARGVSQSTQIETTLFAYRPIVEPESSVISPILDSLSQYSPISRNALMRSRHKEDRENRFDPFASDIDIRFGSLGLDGSMTGRRSFDLERPISQPSVERSISITTLVTKTGTGTADHLGVVGDGTNNILLEGQARAARPTRPRLGDRENTLSLEGRVKRKH